MECGTIYGILVLGVAQPQSRILICAARRSKTRKSISDPDDPGADPGGEEPASDPIYDFFASFMPGNIASILAWIVRYVFFGWLWG
jgi:hypothetical protein